LVHHPVLEKKKKKQIIKSRKKPSEKIRPSNITEGYQLSNITKPVSVVAELF